VIINSINDLWALELEQGDDVDVDFCSYTCKSTCSITCSFTGDVDVEM